MKFDQLGLNTNFNFYEILTLLDHSEKVSFMRIFISLLVLTFGLQSLTKADDISNFSIEGMTIGDSALNFFSKSILDQNKVFDWHDTKIFTPISELSLSGSEVYESFQIIVKTNDKDYKIESIAGFVFYKNNIDECYKKLDDISLDIESMFNDIKNLGKNTYKHSFDKSGKSKVTDIILRDANENEISIQCYDWSSELPYWDQLRITIDTKEYTDWLVTAYD